MFNVIATSGTVVNPSVNAALNSWLTSTLQLALTGLSSLVAYGVNMWIKGMKSSWKQALARRLVKYAESKIIDNTAKYKMVADELSRHFPRMNADETAHLIEEAVIDLKSQLSAPSAPSASVTVATGVVPPVPGGATTAQAV